MQHVVANIVRRVKPAEAGIEMSKKPPVHELKFLGMSANFIDLSGKLEVLDCPSPEIGRYAEYVCRAWLRLGDAHLREAKKLLTIECRRAAFSRAYYAAYNASKGMRYISSGSVSLRGDDHGKASSDLPDDFPDVANWSRRLTTLNKNRLRADYDNWSTTRYELKMKPSEAVEEASKFVRETKLYLRSKHGMKV